MASGVETLEKEANEIRERIEPARQAIRADEEMLARLEAAISMLKGEVAIAPSRTDQFRAAASGRRSSSPIDENAIVTFVGANQPVGATQIGKHVGASGNPLSLKLKAMVDNGVLSKEGQRRSTVYSLKVG
jgi:hypothetical protein